MERTVTAAGKSIKLKASALTPRLYRSHLGRDLLLDITTVIGKNKNNAANVEVCENLAYIMAYHADPSIGTIEEWLDGMGVNAIYELMPEVLELWIDSTATTSVAKKNNE